MSTTPKPMNDTAVDAIEPDGSPARVLPLNASVDRDDEQSPFSSPEELAAAIKNAHATNLREATAAGCMFVSTAAWVKTGIEADAYVEYRNRLLADCGGPDDPLIVMLIEQVALAHFNIGRLHVKSALATSYIESVAYEAAAARLLTEFRRSILVLDDLKTRGTRKASSSRNNKSADRAKSTTKPRRKPRSQVAKKNGHPDKLPPTNGELPQCLKNRMMGRNPITPPLEAIVGANGKG